MTKVIVMIDGLSDSLVPEGSPLELAKKPNIDEISNFGSNGIIRIMPFPVEPDVAFLSLMGNNPFKYYTGRGPLEAIGMNAEFNDGDLAMRCDFVKLEGDTLIGPYISLKMDEAKAIEEIINKYLSIRGVSINVAFDMYGGVLIVKSNRILSNMISNPNPFYKIEFLNMRWEKNGSSWYVPITYYNNPPVKKLLKSLPKMNDQASILSAHIVNKFVDENMKFLEKNPVNMKEKRISTILPRDGGIKIPILRKFNSSVAAIVDEAYERGVIHLMGGRIIPTPGKSKDLITDYKTRALLTISNLYRYDTIIVTLKGPEYYSMSMNKEEKIKTIEKIDKYFFGTLLNEFNIHRDTLAILSMRTFSSKFGIPTIDPSPIVVAGPGFKSDGITSFDESIVKYGSLGQINSIDLYRLLSF